MNTSRTLLIAAVVGLALAQINDVAFATEFFVSKQGNDTNSGTTPQTTFASVQKGVDTLQPGDTLTIAPGEYFEAIKRVDLGSLDHDTVIRAAIPGTVVLRGDVPAPVFRRQPGERFVYVADFEFAGQMSAVNELDTLSILKRMPNSSELEFIPGTFFHDAQAGKLYLSTSDSQPVEGHHYSISVIPTHGVHLVRPRRVVIEGLVVTGFSPMELLHYREETAGGVWGIFLTNGKSCVIRDCRAYLNGWGIGSNSAARDSGDNVIERCVAWANKSPFANGDLGGLTLLAARRDVIRHSTSFLNGMYGVNIYGTGGAPPGGDDGGNTEANKSRLENNLAWGNETADIKIKTGYEYFHTAQDCVAPGLWSVTNITRGLIGRATGAKHELPNNDIRLADEMGIDLRNEFADVDNQDYRLQATSRFRKSGIEGKDRGPFTYVPNVFYVRPEGDDAADGLSISHAWKTLARAVRELRAGDTVYLEPGTYQADFEMKAVGTAAAPIFICGRGADAAMIAGELTLKKSSHVKLERLAFRDGVKIDQGNDLAFDNCEFTAADTSLAAEGVRGLIISHSVFTAFRKVAVALQDCERIDLRGNLFDNAHGAAVRVDRGDAVRYSNYNSYRTASTAWEMAGKVQPLVAVQASHDQHSHELTPEFEIVGGRARLKNTAAFAAGGPFGKPLGRYRDEPRRRQMQLITGPSVHSVSATTANLEWTTSLPATCQLAWGTTPACEHSAAFNVNGLGTYSLTGLQPGETYYFRIKSLATPADILPKTEPLSLTIYSEPIAFSTLAKNRAPAVYYVAADGNDEHSGLERTSAWKSIRHAAEQVNVGDTVLIAGGKYQERIRLRATGEAGSPITFRALPGERVEINGQSMLLNSAFVAGGKSHLRFDGFYLTSFNLFPNDSWSLLNSGEFHLYQGRDIEISRCFSEGRGGYSASPVAAFHIENLTIRNCVNTYKFGGMYFWRCPNLVIENTVFAEPMIMAFVLRNEKDQKATLRNCIFTDMLDKKARLNLGILCCDGAQDSFVSQNDCYYLRDCIPLAERHLNSSQTATLMGKHLLDPLFANPQLAGDPGVKGNPQDKSGFAPDRMMEPTLRLDFDSFFATNPEVLKRDMGLQPAAFADFHFRREKP